MAKIPSGASGRAFRLVYALVFALAAGGAAGCQRRATASTGTSESPGSIEAPAPDSPRATLPSPGRPEAQADHAPPPERTSDRLERAVRAKFAADPELADAGSIVVIVDGPRVVLEGWVAAPNQKTLAEADAASVAGLANVDDRLLVRRAR
ncbi:MAG: BON domain-containing protein [Myxococcales bacterium]|nr:BON domain-containing protein [Myxococcales bacterium]